MQVHLKVKIKSLAAESRIIRHEERKSLRHARSILAAQRKANEEAGVNDEIDLDPLYSKFNSLRQHRITQVRNEARASLIAYGFMRGRAYREIEQKGKTPHAVLMSAHRMIERFGRSVKIADYRAWLKVPPVDKAAEAA
jgi:hypothetical protein